MQVSLYDANWVFKEILYKGNIPRRYHLFLQRRIEITGQVRDGLATLVFVQISQPYLRMDERIDGQIGFYPLATEPFFFCFFYN